MSDTTSDSFTDLTPMERVQTLVEAENASELESYFEVLPPSDVPYVINHLSEENRSKLFHMVSPRAAAEIMQHFEDEQAADFIEELETRAAAQIIDELDSDDQADILGELSDRDARAILAQMEPEEAEDARQLIQYDERTAGGMMHTEYVAFEEGSSIEDVVKELRLHQEEYSENDVDAVYVVDKQGILKGIVRLRDLILAPGNKHVSTVRINDFEWISVDASLDELEDFFDRHSYGSICVLDQSQRLVGVVRREAVEEALAEQSQKALGRFAGIIGGEELRTSPVFTRSVRRMAFLCPNLALSFISISIIAAYEPVIEEITSLAIFLPLVANLSGAAGNQSVAVSIRELALGLVRSVDVFRVLKREVMVGVINGVVIGAIMALMVVALRHEMPMLGLVLGVAYALNSVLSVCLGATIPLLLAMIRVDPAMVSSPVLTTLTDAGSFFLVLSFAAVVLSTAVV